MELKNLKKIFNKNIVYSTITLVFLLGAVSGLVFANFKSDGQEGITIQEVRSSEFVEHITVMLSGDVKKIDKNYITLERNGAEKEISMAKNVIAARLIPPAPGSNLVERETMKIEEIQIGARVNIFAEIQGDGSFLAQAIDVL